MPEERFSHLFLPRPTQTQDFTSPRSGGSSPHVPPRIPGNHSSFLRRKLEAAWENFDNQRSAIVQVEREGAYFDFVGEPGYDLVVKSLEDRRSGIRLRNVRTEGQDTAKRTLATVFVPLSKRGRFLKKLSAYANELTKKGNPKNANLINSISDIRLAVLESFWHPDDLSSIPGDSPEWVEIWFSSERDGIISGIESMLETVGVESAVGTLKFPERVVKLIRADRELLELLISVSDDIAEFRLAKEVATYFVEMEARDQLDRVRELLSRIDFDTETNVAVCILDGGINNQHVLLRPVLADSDLHSVHPHWEVHDHRADGHGTLMAGTAVYGDLLTILNSNNRISIEHRLESAKILPPPPAVNPKELWGYMTFQGISRAEIQAPQRKRIICMAVTSTDDRSRGRPSSWSGAIDEMASGSEDNKPRLIVISAGNVNDPDNWKRYPEDNLTNEVHDPGQAWNALTIGAFTEKIQISDPTLRSYTPIAPYGGLSPYSTTSLNWPRRKWPIKPEVVFEGGNVARGPEESIFDTDDLKLVSTSRDPQVAQFAPFCATSAAAANAANMAARIQSLYPDVWPETIRALIVHSSDWTEAMRQRFLDDNSKKAYAKFLRICGYGVPNLVRALYCMSNSLTLISQAELQPFDRRARDGQFVTRDMHFYNLPWPSEVLVEMGELQVTMRVTLSYFVEPSPGEIGWKDRYRYPSHALRFDINGPSETQEEFVSRINKQARDDDNHPETEGVSASWTIGEARNVGSIHSDIWSGHAADLAASNMIAIFPAVGWWRERHHLNRWNKRCRYSLIISIYAPEAEIDIYTPVAVQLGIAIPVEIPRAGP